jgi:TetR/AcrR family transcriptional repressor of nem operon
MHGYNALSFRDLAKEVGVKSSSVHYHFPTKADLASALASRYTAEAVAYMDDLIRTCQDHDALIAGYTAAFRRALADQNRMCLCGIMAAEFHELPEAVRAEVNRFTAANTRWLEQILANRHPTVARDALHARALAIFAAIEGAQLVARSRGDVATFDQILSAYAALGLFS